MEKHPYRALWTPPPAPLPLVNQALVLGWCALAFWVGVGLDWFIEDWGRGESTVQTRAPRRTMRSWFGARGLERPLVIPDRSCPTASVRNGFFPRLHAEHLSPLVTGADHFFADAATRSLPTQPRRSSLCWFLTV
ncbi:MAG: hypothetical protein WCV84_01015 [Patescibacteria group bacterium]